MNTNTDTDTDTDNLIPKYSKPTTNNNDYYNDVTNLGLHNKDFILVTLASILVIFHCDRM